MVEASPNQKQHDEGRGFTYEPLMYYMTVHGMGRQQHEQSSVLMHPGLWTTGLVTASEIELLVVEEGGIFERWAVE